MEATGDSKAAQPTDRRGRRRQATRRDLVNAAQELLAAEGPAVSVQAIADHADVALATLYSHFPSKDDLLRAATIEALQQFEAEMITATAGIEPLDARWAVRVRLYLRMAQSHPQTARVLSHATPETMANPLGYSPTALADLEAAVEAGSMKCTDPALRLMVVTAAADRFVALTLLDPDSALARPDDLAEDLLTFAGMPAKRAQRLAQEPLVSVPGSEH